MKPHRIFEVFSLVIGLLPHVLIAETTSLVLTSDLVQIEGRVQREADGSVIASFPGVTIDIAFEGEGLDLIVEALQSDLFLDVSVDEGPFRWIPLEEGTQTVRLAEGGSGIHRVRIVRRNETWQGMLRFKSLSLEQGEWNPAPERPERRLLFIGDSITCGSACDIREGGPTEGGFTHNARLSYGYRIARMLDAQVHLVSYGGRGVIRDWQGNRATNNAPQFYERTLADDPESRWDHTVYVPDVVGICLGTNDFSRGIPDQNEFVNAYVELVRKVMRDAPEATVFLIESPMFGLEGADGVKRSALNHYLKQVVEFVGSERVQFLKLGHFPGRPEDAHPVASEHEEIARQLAPSFREALER
ncbi:MAG: GDSL-type esterase/lipase family protein [Puniceicoccaceae bacterium]